MYFKMLFFDWQIEWSYALIDTLTTNGLLLVTCLLVMINLRFYNPTKGKFFHLVILCIAASALYTIIIRFGLASLLTANTSYSLFVEKSIALRFDMAFLITGCAALISTLWHSQEDQRENEHRKTEAEKMARDAELFKLRQQLQPHFLFNSLNSISALAISQPHLARKMIQQLSDFLRGTLKKEEQQQINWIEELQFLNLYLEIEKVRFGHRLSTEITSTPESNSKQLPALLLQPLVENAIKFGLYDTTDSVKISIHAKVENNFLIVIVQNPFDKDTSRPGQGIGFGLSSIQRRLHLLYGRNDLLEASTFNGLYTITLKIPQL